MALEQSLIRAYGDVVFEAAQAAIHEGKSESLVTEQAMIALVDAVNADAGENTRLRDLIADVIRAADLRAVAEYIIGGDMIDIWPVEDESGTVYNFRLRAGGGRGSDLTGPINTLLSKMLGRTPDPEIVRAVAAYLTAERPPGVDFALISVREEHL